MSASNVARAIQDEAGWTDATLLELCLQYISNQADDGCFEDFLQVQADEEEAMTEEVLQRGYF